MLTTTRLGGRDLLFDAGHGVLGMALFGVAAPVVGGGSPLTWHRAHIDFVSAYVLVRGQEAAVVDTGIPGGDVAVGDALRSAGLGWGAVRHVIVTHSHGDHTGGLAAVHSATVSAALAGSASTRLWAGALDIEKIESPSALNPVSDGADIFGLRIIDTPGHTIGHISVFDSATGILVAGDALNTLDGLQGSDPRYTLDALAARASVKRLSEFDVKVILPGHGEPILHGAGDALRALAARG